MAAKEIRPGKVRRLALAMAAAAAVLASSLPAQEDLVRIDSSVTPRRLSRGEQGRVVLRLAVSDGILLYAQPSFVIEFATQPEIVFPKDFFTASDLAIETREVGSENYLTLRKPIEIPFTVSEGAAPGSHILEGRVKFLARSDKDEWCLKSAAKFSIPYSTRLSVKLKTGEVIEPPVPAR